MDLTTQEAMDNLLLCYCMTYILVHNCNANLELFRWIFTKFKFTFYGIIR